MVVVFFFVRCVCVCFKDLDIQKSQVKINLNAFLTALNKQKPAPYCKWVRTVTQEDRSHQKIYTHSNTSQHEVASATRRNRLSPRLSSSQMVFQWLTKQVKAGLMKVKLGRITLSVFFDDYKLLPVTKLLWHITEQSLQDCHMGSHPVHRAQAQICYTSGAEKHYPFGK